MMRVLKLLCLVVAVSAVRKRRVAAEADTGAQIIFRRRRSRRRAPAFTWTSRTDSNAGPCADYMGHVMPVSIPLWCSGEARDLRFTAEARGRGLPRLRLSIDDADKGYLDWPVLAKTKSWQVSHDRLAAGLHYVRYSGDRLDLNHVEVSGFGGSCSFDTYPGFDVDSFQNAGMDVLIRVFGPNRNFSTLAKRQLHFVMETVGTTADGSISASVVSDAMWGWMYRYSQEQNPGDKWFMRYEDMGVMYEEADITPHREVSLDQLPGFDGSMAVLEPCNTVSNIAAHQAAVWLSCQGHPFGREEMAILIMGLNAMAAGSTFFHGSGTNAGHQGDVVPIDVFLGQTYQLMVKDAAFRAKGLTDAERQAILFLRDEPAAVHAREMTELLGGTYNRSIWYEDFKKLNDKMVSYDIWAVAAILAVFEALEGKYPVPGMGLIVRGAVEAILLMLPDLVDGDDAEWLVSIFRPAVRKLFREEQLCRPAAPKVLGSLIKFFLTFVEGFVFQEEKFPVPQAITDLFLVLDMLGLNTDLLSDMQPPWDYYNGEASLCHQRSTHGIWHEKSSHAMLHGANLAALMIENTHCGLLGVPPIR